MELRIALVAINQNSAKLIVINPTITLTSRHTELITTRLERFADTCRERFVRCCEKCGERSRISTCPPRKPARPGGAGGNSRHVPSALIYDDSSWESSISGMRLQRWSPW